MRSIFKRALSVIAAAVASALVLFAILFLAIVQPGGDGVLAAMRFPDGSEYMVTQRCNWGGEPYTVAFYMRASGGPWGWCYIDHEANRWWNVAMRYDELSDAILVTEKGKLRARLDRSTGKFWIDNGSIRRDLAAPQSIREPEFPFPT